MVLLKILYRTIYIYFITVPLTSSSPNYEFPQNFKFGVATSAYQIEGGRNADGKTESIWDYQTRVFPNNVLDGSNGDIACDSYHKTDEDIANLKNLNVHMYRFSLSWPRILPTGFTNEINHRGVKHYRTLIKKLIQNGIEPVVTLYHWDLPQSLQELGGWTNEKMADYFADYAKVCFHLFGDLVKTWITLNEPYQICQFAYAELLLAPFHNSTMGNYMCGHTVILAHAKAYRLYQKLFKERQGGRIGITIETPWFKPFNATYNNQVAAETQLQFYFGWFAHPIYSKDGDYPEVMRRRIDRISSEQGFTRSRLPSFSRKEIRYIRGSWDFLGLNHYTTKYCEEDDSPVKKVPSIEGDAGGKCFFDDRWKHTGAPFLRSVPWGLKELLMWLKHEYNNPEIIITENGYAGFQNDTLNDCERIVFHNEYLQSVLEAIHGHGSKVTAYFAWSFIDTYEWFSGYTLKFGMYHVDFNDPERRRTPKKSAGVYRNIIRSRKIDHNLSICKTLA